MYPARSLGLVSIPYNNWIVPTSPNKDGDRKKLEIQLFFLSSDLFGTGKKCSPFSFFHSNKRRIFWEFSHWDDFSGGGTRGRRLPVYALPRTRSTTNRHMTPGEGSRERERDKEVSQKKPPPPPCPPPPPPRRNLFAGRSPSLIHITPSLDADVFFRQQAICDLLLGPGTIEAGQTGKRTFERKTYSKTHT